MIIEKDSNVATINGLIQIKDINIGDKVFNVNGLEDVVISKIEHIVKCFQYNFTKVNCMQIITPLILNDSNIDIIKIYDKNVIDTIDLSKYVKIPTSSPNSRGGNFTTDKVKFTHL